MGACIAQSSGPIAQASVSTLGCSLAAVEDIGLGGQHDRGSAAGFLEQPGPSTIPCTLFAACAVLEQPQ